MKPAILLRPFSVPHPSSLVRRPSSGVRHLSSVRRPSSVVCRLTSAFTLLEVLVVMAIIAILAGLLYPVVIGAHQRAKQKQAAAETRLVFAAIKAYRQEYGKWPAQIQATQDTTYIISNYCVIQPLLGSNWNGFNSKGKVFLHIQVSISNNLDTEGNYLDPWGVPYVICMDENGDNKLLIDTNRIFFAFTNASGREIATNIQIAANLITVGVNTNVVDADAGVASLGGTFSNISLFNTWEEMK